MDGFNVRKRTRNLRKKEEEEQEIEDSTVVVKKGKTNSGDETGMEAAAGIRKLDTAYVTSGKAIVGPRDMNATAAAEYETSFDRDARALLEKSLQVNKSSKELSENYMGQSSYKTYIEKQENSKGSVASRSLGPVRIASNIRATNRFDFQQDICKDYKESGICGFGDSCKFIHDRGDYKTGWELELEWEANKNKKTEQEDNGENEFLIREDEQTAPSDCKICGEEFVKSANPVKSECGHVFCQNCVIERMRKTKKCIVCGAEGKGLFVKAKKEEFIEKQ